LRSPDLVDEPDFSWNLKQSFGTGFIFRIRAREPREL